MNFFLTSGNVSETVIFYGIIFHNIAPLKFTEFILYFVVLVTGKVTLSSLKTSDAKNFQCFRFMLISSWSARRPVQFFSYSKKTTPDFWFINFFRFKFRISPAENPYYIL